MLIWTSYLWKKIERILGINRLLNNWLKEFGLSVIGGFVGLPMMQID
jgi:hypothetical protein